jgi:hypothetical protein
VDCGVRRRGFHGDWAYSMNVRRPSPISRHRVTARVVSAMPATNAVGRAKTHQRPSLSHGGASGATSVRPWPPRPARPQHQGACHGPDAGADAAHREGQGLNGAVTATVLAVLQALLWGFHNAASGKCFPSYEANRRRCRLRQEHGERGDPRAGSRSASSATTAPASA